MRSHLLTCADGGASLTSLEEGRRAVAACLRDPRCHVDENLSWRWGWWLIQPRTLE